jgi:hypothetical protein
MRPTGCALRARRVAITWGAADVRRVCAGVRRSGRGEGSARQRNTRQCGAGARAERAAPITCSATGSRGVLAHQRWDPNQTAVRDGKRPEPDQRNVTGTRLGAGGTEFARHRRARTLVGTPVFAEALGHAVAVVRYHFSRLALCSARPGRRPSLACRFRACRHCSAAVDSACELRGSRATKPLLRWRRTSPKTEMRSAFTVVLQWARPAGVEPIEGVNARGRADGAAGVRVACSSRAVVAPREQHTDTESTVASAATAASVVSVRTGGRGETASDGRPRARGTAPSEARGHSVSCNCATCTRRLPWLPHVPVTMAVAVAVTVSVAVAVAVRARKPRPPGAGTQSAGTTLGHAARRCHWATLAGPPPSNRARGVMLTASTQPVPHCELASCCVHNSTARRARRRAAGNTTGSVR